MEELNDSGLVFLIKKIVSDYNRIGVVNVDLYLSFFSRLFKIFVANDEFLQNFETEFCRKNAYKLHSFSNFVIEIDNDIDCQKWKIFKDVSSIFLCFFENRVLEQGVLTNNEINNNELNRLLFDIKSCFDKETLSRIDKICQQQTFDDIERQKRISLSPTQGISMLNNNPYAFFIKKILHIDVVDDWCQHLDAKEYGSIIHKIMEIFHKRYKESLLKHNTTNLDGLFDAVCKSVLDSKNIKLSSFLNFKLQQIKEIAIALEKQAEENNYLVLVEKQFYTTIQGVEIKACADRIEIDNTCKQIYIYDFKTGTLPSNNDEVNGYKPQLLIIAFLILQNDKYKDYKIKTLQYIDISGKSYSKNNGFIDVKHINIVAKNITALIERYFYIDDEFKLNLQHMLFIKQNCQNLLTSEKKITQFKRCKFL